MKVRVKAPFYNDNGLHKIGEIIETASFDTFLMEKIEVEKKEAEEVVKEVKKTKRTTTKK